MRQFKVEFFGENGDGKNVFVLNCHVVSQKRFNKMSSADLKAAINTIESWEKSLQGFKQDLVERKNNS